MASRSKVLGGFPAGASWLARRGPPLPCDNGLCIVEWVFPDVGSEEGGGGGQAELGQADLSFTAAEGTEQGVC